MSPTNHSAPNPPDVAGYPSSTFSSFSFKSSKTPIYHLNSQGSSSPSLPKPLESTTFSCLSQAQSSSNIEQLSYDDKQGSLFSHPENNNWRDSNCCRGYDANSQKETCKSCNNAMKLHDDDPKSGAAQIPDASFVAENLDGMSLAEQREEDAQHLGPGGYSQWRGEGGSGTWVRKMGYGERFMTGSTDFGCMSTVYNLWFESKADVQLDTIRRTCYLVARKLPHLRLCVGYRDEELWFKEMDELKVDVDEIFTKDIMHTFEILLKKKFNLEKGPLWFTRFIKIDNNDSTDTPVKNFDAECRFVCLFGFHHNFSDGTTNMKFCNVFLKVLNDVLLGKPIDMKVEAQLSEPFHDRMADKLKKYWSTYMWIVTYICKRFYKGVIKYGHLTSNYTDHFQQPINYEAATHIIPGELDEDTTSRLLARCKAEKTTLNSAFTAAANIALYKLILEQNPNLDSTCFGGIQTVNMRRYWTKEQAKDSCGCHISTLDVNIPTDKKDIDDFWGYSRRIKDIMHDELNVSKRGIKLMLVSARLRLILQINALMDYLGCASMNDNHYCVTNMGDLSKQFSGTGEVVETIRLLRSVTCHYMPNLCQHTLHTFRGRFCYTLDYYAQKMEPNQAKLYATAVLATLQEAIDAPKLSHL
ncbi:Condensation domain [Trinorchestia longiramus]|nr:Condensation domain [Trinorchestia longiramus]